MSEQWISRHVEDLKPGDEVKDMGVVSHVGSQYKFFRWIHMEGDISADRWPSHAVVQVRQKPKRWRISFETDSQATMNNWLPLTMPANAEKLGPFRGVTVEEL